MYFGCVLIIWIEKFFNFVESFFYFSSYVFINILNKYMYKVSEYIFLILNKVL